MIKPIAIRDIVLNLEAEANRASRRYYQWSQMGDDWDNPAWDIEACFIQLLAALEICGLPNLRQLVYDEYAALKQSSDSFTADGSTPDGEPHSPVLSRIRQFVSALKALVPADNSTTVTKDLLDIIRNVHYVISQTDIYQWVPRNEDDVHVRIEAILKCVFPDLKRKPSLSKQIKNFEPDTGIPSLRTLIEYKFLSKKEQTGPIADQLLADTRGYNSGDWDRFLYVIYETQRFRTENDWNQLMKESGVPSNTSVVVLCGEPKANRLPRRQKKKIAL